MDQDNKRNQKLKVIIDQIFNSVLSPNIATQAESACWVFQNMAGIKFAVSLIILVNILPVKWGSLSQQILDAFNLNYIY